jgi:putative colanic acid biosynthesis UDP-glucose lipid carrier transferase
MWTSARVRIEKLYSQTFDGIIYGAVHRSIMHLLPGCSKRASAEFRALGSPKPTPVSSAYADMREHTAGHDPLRLLKGSVGACDATVIFIFSLIAFMLRYGVEPMPLDIVATSLLASLLAVNALSILGAYGAYFTQSIIAQIWRAAQALTAAFAVLLAIGYLTRVSSEYSRIWATTWYVSSLGGIAVVRLVAAARLGLWKREGYLIPRIAIVDLGGRGASFANTLTRGGSFECSIVGIFQGSHEGRSGRSISDLIKLSYQVRVDDVFVLLDKVGSGEQKSDLKAILRRLGTMTANVHICPISPDLGHLPIRGIALLDEMPLLTIHRRPIDAWSRVFKRCEDLLIGGLALLLLWPIMLVIAASIKIDSPGPVLFRQARQGFNNNVFTVLKFRTMTAEPPSDGEIIQATRFDKRVTRLGRILRRTSLDELPQLFNVLRGEMSLVGPRPHAVAHNQYYAELIDDYLGRHRVPPGITGWAQINGFRGETDTLDKMRGRVDYDLSYINSWSITLDLKIIALTSLSFLFDRRAY